MHVRMDSHGIKFIGKPDGNRAAVAIAITVAVAIAVVVWEGQMARRRERRGGEGVVPFIISPRSLHA